MKKLMESMDHPSFLYCWALKLMVIIQHPKIL